MARTNITVIGPIAHGTQRLRCAHHRCVPCTVEPMTVSCKGLRTDAVADRVRDADLTRRARGCEAQHVANAASIGEGAPQTKSRLAMVVVLSFQSLVPNRSWLP